MQSLDDRGLRIVVDGPAGAFGNNIYLLIDRATGEAAFVDAPGEPEKSIALAESLDVRPRHILLTHAHHDHTAGIAALKARFGCVLVADAREPGLVDGQPDIVVAHGDAISIGSTTLTALSVPGHTPGSITYVYGSTAFTGDTLFPGGPGRTPSHAAFLEELASIQRELYVLPDGTAVLPGHGALTTIGESKAEYAVFASREHDTDLHGDVIWFAS